MICTRWWPDPVRSEFASPSPVRLYLISEHLSAPFWYPISNRNRRRISSPKTTALHCSLERFVETGLKTSPAGVHIDIAKYGILIVIIKPVHVTSRALMTIVGPEPFGHNDAMRPFKCVFSTYCNNNATNEYHPPSIKIPFLPFMLSSALQVT